MLEVELSREAAASDTPGSELLAGLAGRLTALFFLILLTPALAVFFVKGRHRGTRVVRRPRLGRDGREFGELGLELDPSTSRTFGRLGVERWPALLNVLLGELALVGPRARSRDELDRGDPGESGVLGVKPGLVCSWWIRRRRGIDYGSELEADLEYVSKHGPATDLGLLARAAAAAIYGDAEPAPVTECRILGVRADVLSMDAAVDRIAALAADSTPSQVCFANADCLNWACRDGAYRATLAGAQLVLPDGIGIRLAGRITGQSIRYNVNGTDLFPRLCDRLAGEERRVFLLGGKPGIAAKVQAYIESHHPALVVAGAHHGYFSDAEEPDVIDEVRRSRADVLLVAFGAPRQDRWIRDNLARLGVRVALGVGGLFDFYSFTLPRAPQWVRELGMEWAFRLVQEPRRLWRRYVIGNVVFLARVVLEASGLARHGDERSRDDTNADRETRLGLPDGQALA